jgi:hypothetical protein
MKARKPQQKATASKSPVARRLGQWKKAKNQNAKNQPKKLSVLRVFQDLCLFFHDFVAEDSCLVLAPTFQMSRLYAPSLPARFPGSCGESGEKYCTPGSR